MLMTDSRHLTDDELIARIAAVAGTERTATATLIIHLAELESRNLHLAQGFRSLFGYCRHVLHCSEHEAYNRMEAVHAARRFPVILAMLAEGRLHLTAVRLLAPRLRNEDHLALLGGAIHKSRREIVALLARWFPSAAATPETATTPVPIASPTANPTVPLRRVPEAQRPVVAPLSADRYKLQVTLGQASHDDLRCLQDLMRREIPDGDPAAIVARGLRLLRQDAEKKAFAATTRPRPPREAKAGSRDIPAHVERAVWLRDDGQCAFEGPRARCPERSFLEFHHVRPWVVGGLPSVENIALRCRAHNAYEAGVYFAPIRAGIESRIRSGTNSDGRGSTLPAP
jgi:hypothetical protein